MGKEQISGTEGREKQIPKYFLNFRRDRSAQLSQ